MIVTAELSLYPNCDNYAEVVTDYILALRTFKNISVETTGLSTYVYGAEPDVWEAIQQVTRALWEKQQAVLCIKIAKGELRAEALPDILKS